MHLLKLDIKTSYKIELDYRYYSAVNYASSMFILSS